MPLRLFILMMALSSVLSCFSQAPDFLFVNGKVFTLNEKQFYAEAVAVRGNRIEPCRCLHGRSVPLCQLSMFFASPIAFR